MRRLTAVVPPVVVVLVAGAVTFSMQGREPASDFTGGTEEWTVRGGLCPLFEPHEGRPAGSISGTGMGMGSPWSFRAPDKFYGNRAAW